MKVKRDQFSSASSASPDRSLVQDRMGFGSREGSFSIHPSPTRASRGAGQWWGAWHGHPAALGDIKQPRPVLGLGSREWEPGCESTPSSHPTQTASPACHGDDSFATATQSKSTEVIINHWQFL